MYYIKVYHMQKILQLTFNKNVSGDKKKIHVFVKLRSK